MKIKNHQLIGTIPNRAGAGIGEGVKPDQRMGEDGGETFAQTRPAAFAGASLGLDQAGIACILRRVLNEDREQDRGDRDDERRNAEEPMPVVFRNDPSADGEARENDRREIVDRELARAES